MTDEITAVAWISGDKTVRAMQLGNQGFTSMKLQTGDAGNTVRRMMREEDRLDEDSIQLDS